MKLPTLPAFQAILLACVLMYFTLGEAQAGNEDIVGKWKIVELTGGADIVGKSDSAARSLVGKSFYVSPRLFQFNGKTCERPEYMRSREETVRYFHDAWGADSSDLHLPNPVTVIDTGCYLLYPQRKSRLIIAVDGIFYTAVRVAKK